MKPNQTANPLENLDEWEEDLLRRYPDPETIAKEKTVEEYRNYDDPKRETVKEFYRLNHTFQTYDFVMGKRADYLAFNKKQMNIWGAFEFLNQLVDDSDPDTDLDQMQHLLQTSEAIRRDGHPDWMVLVGLMHDMGKVLCLFGEPQWAVVGDTFPVGCAHSDKIVYPEFFSANPDSTDERFNSKHGVYNPNCGLNNVTMSWGHDEYVYQMMKDYIPEPGLYMLRYHSFYAQHREDAYDHLLDRHDQEMFKWVNLFNPYDLYSKNPDAAGLETTEAVLRRPRRKVFAFNLEVLNWRSPDERAQPGGLHSILHLLRHRVDVWLPLVYHRKRKFTSGIPRISFLPKDHLPGGQFGASLIASNISAEHFIGMSGSGFALGLAISTYEWMASATLIIVAVFFVPIYLKNKIYTMPQFLARRYGETVSTIMAIFWLLVYVFVNLTSILYLGAMAINSISGHQFRCASLGSPVFPLVRYARRHESDRLYRRDPGCGAHHRRTRYNLPGTHALSEQVWGGGTVMRDFRC